LLVSASSFAKSETLIRYVWNGELTKEELNIFREQLKANPNLSELEFRQSVGAGSSAVIILNELSSLIEKRHLKTFARGQCASACAFAFLMGKERALLPSSGNVPTYLMIHAMRSNVTGEINYGATDNLIKIVSKVSGGKFSPEILEKIYDAKNSMGGMYITREPVKTEHGKASIFFCSGEEAALKKACNSFGEARPENFGISIAN
jgi:hypothetical protein